MKFQYLSVALGHATLPGLGLPTCEVRGWTSGSQPWLHTVISKEALKKWKSLGLLPAA